MRALRVLIPVLALLGACSDPLSKSSAQIPPLAQPTRAAPGDAATIVAELEAAGWYVWMVDELPANPDSAPLTPADIAVLSGVTV